MSGPLEGRNILVTGASRGIGKVVANTLASAGARLGLVARSAADLDVTVGGLMGSGHVAMAFDVTDPAAWKASLGTFGSDGVHGLVTAAGVIGPIGRPEAVDLDEFRRTIDINVTGTLLAITSCLDSLRARKGSIVTFSGGGATGPLVGYDAYATSKAALVRLTENLSRELAADGVRVNAVAPGFVRTAMHDATLAAGPEAVGAEYYEKTKKLVESGGGDPPELAAELCRFLLSEESVGITGKLISARWDPWQEADFQRRLREESDLATLRRIDDQFFTAVVN